MDTFLNQTAFEFSPLSGCGYGSGIEVHLYISEIRTILSYRHPQEPECLDKRGSTVVEQAKQTRHRGKSLTSILPQAKFHDICPLTIADLTVGGFPMLCVHDHFSYCLDMSSHHFRSCILRKHLPAFF